jgi:protein-S-isoprenylcysteine O-methyltransferase Ste14
MIAVKAGLIAWIGYDLVKILQFVWWQQGGAAELLFAAALGVMIVNVARRPGTHATRFDAPALIACFVSLAALAVALEAADYSYRPSTASDLLAIASATLLLWSASAIGTSFTVLPAAIGVKQRGPYSLVRHPIYLAYLLGDLGLALACGHWAVTLALLAESAALIWRARLEEELLQGALPEYRDYLRRVRFRFVPGLA